MKRGRKLLLPVALGVVALACVLVFLIRGRSGPTGGQPEERMGASPEIDGPTVSQPHSVTGEEATVGTPTPRTTGPEPRAATRPRQTIKPARPGMNPEAEPVATALRPEVEGIVKRDPAATYNSLSSLAHGLGKDLTKNEVDALYEFLASKWDEKTGLSLLGLDSVKNDVLDKLLLQDTMAPALGARIVAMYRDATLDEVWRDYCVQHFGTYCERMWPEGSEIDKNAAEWQEVETGFWEATRETGKSFAGTALIGLDNLSAKHPEIDRTRLSSNALAIAANEGAGAASRVTALQVCASTGNKDALSTARLLAQTGDAVPLRMSAIALLGELGTSDDLELLRSLAADRQKYVARAAATALKNCEKRQPKQ